MSATCLEFTLELVDLEKSYLSAFVTLSFMTYALAFGSCALGISLLSLAHLGTDLLSLFRLDYFLIESLRFSFFTVSPYAHNNYGNHVKNIAVTARGVYYEYARE